jgi:hypothetical protein
MSQVIEVPFSDASVNAIVRAGFPGASSRRNVKVCVSDSYQVNDYWSGGSRDECAFVDLASLRALSSAALPAEARQQEGNPYKLAIGEVAIVPGFAVVEHCIFQGRDLGYRVYLNAANMAPLLTKGAEHSGVSERDRRILVAYRSLKSGPYRQEALTALKVTPEDVTRLCRLGFLKQAKNGATGITNEGRALTANDR